MKSKKKESLLGQVVARDYDVSGSDCPHSPAMTIKNLKRHDKILEKMRKAGITKDEIHFLVDFYQSDVVHVQKLMTANADFEAKKNSVN